jgi:hypothetical protein
MILSQGCANVDVRKVPLDKRVSNCDQHVNGFRYYLSRPYVVLKARIELGQVCEEVEEIAVRRVGQPDSVVPAYRTLHNNLALHPPRVYSLTGEGINLKEWEIVLREKAKSRPKALEQTSYQTEIPSGPTQTNPVRNVVQTPSTPVGSPEGGKDDFSNNIQVVFLPDFEEQYAVQPRNIAAKTKFELHFTDGWQLDSTAATLDSTDVPIALLNLIQNALKATSATQQKAQGTTTSGGAKDEGQGVRGDSHGRLVLVRTFFLEPGLYRVQKSWERTAGGDQTVDEAMCLLTSLGLEVHEENRILPDALAKCGK